MTPRTGMAKTVAFTVTAVLLFFLAVEGLLIVAGVEPAARTEDPFVGFAGAHPLFVPDPDDPSRRITSPGKLTYFNPQGFPATKPPGTYRIFTVGGSTTFGRPYADATSFSGWLREMLPAADPSRTWEVVNAGGISYASYRVAAVVEELAQYEPDLFIVYTGHNEFLERRTYGALLDTPVALREAGAWLDRTRTYTALRRALGRGTTPPEVLPAEVDAVLDRSIGPDDYRRDDTERVRVLNHFRFNLERIVALARGAGADVLFVTPGSNLADSAPFKSQPTDGVSGTDLELAVRARGSPERGGRAPMGRRRPGVLAGRLAGSSPRGNALRSGTRAPAGGRCRRRAAGLRPGTRGRRLRAAGPAGDRGDRPRRGGRRGRSAHGLGGNGGRGVSRRHSGAGVVRGPRAPDRRRSRTNCRRNSSNDDRPGLGPPRSRLGRRGKRPGRGARRVADRSRDPRAVPCKPGPRCRVVG
ncbi:MAG: hypothetical protein HKN12_10915, partial [Gemmatimonadetes bacterium]|nr:hypothetical protein [Gemmatimonadota bacterium]